VILGDQNLILAGTVAPTGTLGVWFLRAVARHPEAVALVDPPNRNRFMYGAPRRLTYAEADRSVSAIAKRLRQLGLPVDAVVGIQLPNTVEYALAILGVLRAGMIAAPLPALWRHADLGPALARLGAKALIASGVVGGADLCTGAMRSAADVFSIRHVCGFGPNLPDGIVSLDGPGSENLGPATETPREGISAEHVAMVTMDVAPNGLVPVARSHKELVAGGRVSLLEGGLQQDARLLGCCAMGSFAGLALTLVPWLLTGGTLSFHHGFEPAVFATQCRDDGCDAVVVPAPLMARLARTDLLAQPELKNVLALWRAPESFAASPFWQIPGVAVADMLAFGEIALLGSRRAATGEPVPLPAGAIKAPRAPSGLLLAEMARTEVGSVALRGPMVPRHAFPPGAEHGDMPFLKADAAGYVDTRYACRRDRSAGTFEVTAPPPGIVAVGGYRFSTNEMDRQVAMADAGAFITALPHALAGHRLAGISAVADARTALAEKGVNPLLAEAFSSGHDQAA
jgi:hypothetical protein